ncbi:unnamed protein product [Clavelina lepadiformis]|uniref:Ubiquinone biosynthesis protein n=1 Tax=Clavelina lepadiformis TaxID=159417 RepID=A0ABP0FD35_CLALP
MTDVARPLSTVSSKSWNLQKTAAPPVCSPCTRKTVLTWIIRQYSMNNDSSDEQQSPTGDSSTSNNESNSHKNSEQAEGTTDQKDNTQDEFHTDNADDTVDIKTKILDNALDFVHEYKWSRKAISSGAEAAGLAGVSEGMFKGGGEDLVLHFVRQSNIRLQHFMKESVKRQDEEGEKMKSSEFIRKAIEFRLRLIVPYMDNWSDAMGVLLRPNVLPKSAEELAMMVDDIWFYAGDKSSDFSWYTKRGMLAKLYGSTQLFMLMDQSPDFKDTWEFLDRRLDDIKNIAEISQSISTTADAMFQAAFSSATILKNILGFPDRKR